MNRSPGRYLCTCASQSVAPHLIQPLFNFEYLGFWIEAPSHRVTAIGTPHNLWLCHKQSGKLHQVSETLIGSNESWKSQDSSQTGSQIPFLQKNKNSLLERSESIPVLGFV